MNQYIKIKFQKSPTDKYCKKCKWHNKYNINSDKYNHECLLFYGQLQTEDKEVLRCQECLSAEFQDSDKRFLRYKILNSEYETCGDCLLQYHSELNGGCRTCPAFSKSIQFQQGLNNQGDDVYELHYRCTVCKKSVIAS